MSLFPALLRVEENDWKTTGPTPVSLRRWGRCPTSSWFSNCSFIPTFIKRMGVGGGGGEVTAYFKAGAFLIVLFWTASSSTASSQSWFWADRNSVNAIILFFLAFFKSINSLKSCKLILLTSYSKPGMLRTLLLKLLCNLDRLPLFIYSLFYFVFIFIYLLFYLN